MKLNCEKLVHKKANKSHKLNITNKKILIYKS